MLYIAWYIELFGSIYCYTLSAFSKTYKLDDREGINVHHIL